MDGIIVGKNIHEKNEISANQAIFIHELALSSQAGGFLLSILVLFAFQSAIELSTLLIWFAVTNTISLLRLLHWFNAKAFINDEAYMLSWLPKMQILLLLSGLCWGIGSWFLYLPDNYLLSTLLFLFIIGIISGGIGALSPHLPCYIIYSLSTGIPFSVKLIYEHETTSILMPIALILYMAINILYARNIRNNILKIILLRFENEELVDQLKIKRHEAEDQAELAKSANISKSKFLAAASHDLAQPLHSLTLFLSALSDTTDAKEHAKYLSKAQLCASNMNELFSALMDITRLDAGIVEPNIQEYNSNDLIEPIIHEFEIKAQERQLKLDITIDDYLIETDGVIFQRIIRNLLSNAVKHNKNCTIGIKTSYSKNYFLKIDIFDNGIGIPKNELDNIFKEFYQLNNPERDNTKGLGLGLAIVRRLANLINSHVSASSVINQGTCFSLILPYARHPESNFKQMNTTSISDLSKFTVLLIDDDKLIRDATEAVVKSWKSKIVTAESHTQALDILINTETIPDIIISDYRLRDMNNGIDAVQAIREEFNLDIPAIIITGETSATVVEAIKSSKLKLLHKPINSDQLKESVSYILLQNSENQL